MSIADDNEFSKKLSTRGTEVGKLQNKIASEKNDTQKLEKKVEQVEKELEYLRRSVEALQYMQPCVCQQTIYNALSAAMAPLPPTPQFIEGDSMLTAVTALPSPSEGMTSTTRI